jgi:hypothetical protein
MVAGSHLWFATPVLRREAVVASAPVTIHKRPFAVFPLTNVMLPDGIFDVSLRTQRLTCHVTNDSSNDLTNVEVYLESVGDLGVSITAVTHHLGTVRAGASVMVAWNVDFTNASPGKKLVSIRVSSTGFTINRCIQRIFVSRTTYDENTKTWSVEVPEGVMQISGLTAIGPTHSGWDQHDRSCPPTIGPWIPTKMSMRFVPNPSYTGTHGELPFGDPWWKILGWIVAAIAAIVAIVAAALGAGNASVSVGGTFDETEPNVNCCTPKVSGDFTVAGVASAIAGVAAIVGMADDADPFWRGQAAVPPPEGTLTVWENIDVVLSYPDAPNAGVAYQVNVEWTYTRGLSDGTTLNHSASETKYNTHIANGVTVTAPDKVVYHDEYLCIDAAFASGGGGLFVGDDLYAVAIFVSPAGLSFVEMMNDAGTDGDAKPNDGTYTACLDLAAAYKEHIRRNLDMEGWWKIYVFAQDINGATPDQLPEVAAQSIGGYVVAGPVDLTFDPTLPCPLKAQATVFVEGP